MVRPTASWKDFERRVSRVFGLRRRGAFVSDGTSGKNDAIELDGRESPTWSLEIKLKKQLNYQALLDACRQAEAATVFDTQEPVVVAKMPNKRDGDALVVQRLAVFREWRLPPQDGAEGEGGEDG